MRQYYSNNKNYNAIHESMAQIRQNQLNEQHGYFVEAEHEDEEMQEGMHGDEEEMEERFMYEGEHEDDEDAQMEALAEMMDEALMELDQDDDDDQMLGEEEEDGERRARRRARLRNALLIGAGLVATGGLGAAAAMGKLPGAFGQQTMKNLGTAIGGMIPNEAAREQMIQQGQAMIDQARAAVPTPGEVATMAHQGLSKYGKPAREFASQVQQDLGIKAKDMKFMDTPQAQSFGDDNVRMGRYDYSDPSAYIKKRASGLGNEFSL